MHATAAKSPCVSNFVRIKTFSSRSIFPPFQTKKKASRRLFQLQLASMGSGCCLKPLASMGSGLVVLPYCYYTESFKVANIFLPPKAGEYVQPDLWLFTN
jgi:hypothetical protein